MSPIIFKNESRERAKNTMYENGYNLIKKHGIKKTLVEDITKVTGIAKGTFYNFFESKEMFIYEIIVYKRKCIKDMLNEIILKNGKLDKESLKKFIDYLTYGDNNIYTYLNDDDMIVLELKVPEATSSKAFDRDVALMILNSIDIKERNNCDYKIIANYIKIFALMVANKNKLNDEVLSQTTDIIINSLLNYIFVKV
ncbi:MAG: TetR/AcrR family transcriptional regulator [Clostridia bacterium]|nr:TetR/AcrR family transcriptional regulator [Clostridia bacterium]MDD4386707.1 TetR/AcrR family transcriptional regulator [Clostridia bacterium]